MSPIDILFWLLILLLAGIGWAVEAGLTRRHRNALACSTLSAFASVLFIMFWIEDNSEFKFGPVQPIKVKKKAGNDGGFEYDVTVEQSDGKKDGGVEWAKKDDAEPVKKPGEDDHELTSKYRSTPFADCPGCPEMVILPAGTFNFGSPPTEPGRSRDEPVSRPVSFQRPFAVSRTEILRGEFEAFVKASGHVPAANCDIQKRTRQKYNWARPGFEQDASHPVVCISWTDANAYAMWLSAYTSRVYRLPTEQEWEYAARAGTSTTFWTGDDVLRVQANFARTRDGTIAAGLLASNAFGVSGVLGNAAEMTATCADPKPDVPKLPDVAKLPAVPPAVVPLVQPARPVAVTQPGGVGRTAVPVDPLVEPEPKCMLRAVRGGSWNSPKVLLRSAARTTIGPTTVNNFNGFRLAREIEPSDDDKRLTKGQERAQAAAEAAAREIEEKEAAVARKAAMAAAKIADEAAKKKAAEDAKKAEKRKSKS